MSKKDLANEAAERLFGVALRKVEPPKVEGESFDRQAWLRMVMAIQMYLITMKLDEGVFIEELLS